MFGKILVDLLLFLSGVYFVYASFYLKKGFLDKAVSFPEQSKVPAKENLDCFIKKMFPITLLTGVCGCISFVLSLINDILGCLKTIPYYAVLLYLIMITTYAFLANRCKNRFLVISQ